MTHQSTQSIGDPRPIPKRVLVLGSTGMVGRSWIECLRSKQIECVGVSRPEFDLMNPESIISTIGEGFDLVVNAAAWTDVDGAESDEAGATRANSLAVEEIALCCRRREATLISYSTDYVFSGDGEIPYSIDAQIAPINTYGLSKADGEARLAQSAAEYILIRTSWVYAPWGKNFVRSIRDLSLSRDELQVVDDQRGRPTSAKHLAKGSLELYLCGARGTWHLTDQDECSWFEFARQIAQISRPECTVRPCGSDQYPSPATRPTYSTLDIDATDRIIGPLGSWRTHLREVLKAIEAQDDL
jgi:dTDP-4-dehydrorhamnose reductase